MFGDVCSPCLFDLVTNKVIYDASDFQDVSFELANGEKLCDLVCPFESSEHAQRALDKLLKVVAPFGPLCAFEVYGIVTGSDDASNDPQLTTMVYCFS